MNRREFIICGTAMAAAGCVADRRVLGGGAEYSVSVLGDLHYDRPPVDVFHSGFRKAHGQDGYFNQYRVEFESFSSMWGAEGKSPELLVSAGRCRTADMAFAVQLGDIVEGDCEAPDAHARMLEEAFCTVKRAYGGDLPLVTTAGNHDVRRGWDRQGEYDAYCRISSAWHSRELSMRVTGPTFAFRQGPDVWIVADFNRPDVPLVERLLTENSDARYTFFCTHGAVLTNGNRGKRRWFFLGCPQYGADGRTVPGWFDRGHPQWDADRRRVRRLLAERNAIALTGHSHRLEVRDWFGDGGRITELVVSSITKDVKGRPVPGVPRVVGERPADFGRCRVSPREGKSEIVDALYDEYVPGMRRYFSADAAGHVRLCVSDEAVLADYFPCGGTVPERTLALRGDCPPYFRRGASPSRLMI